jgi:hypothetical protein
MRSIRQLCVQAVTLSIFVTGVALLTGPGCSLFASESECTSACNLISTCTPDKIPSCSAYCAGMVVAVATTGCGSQFDDQNSCMSSVASGDCTGEAKCTDKVTAFAGCLKKYCETNPNAQACSLAGMGAGTAALDRAPSDCASM